MASDEAGRRRRPQARELGLLDQEGAQELGRRGALLRRAGVGRCCSRSVLDGGMGGDEALGPCSAARGCWIQSLCGMNWGDGVCSI